MDKFICVYDIRMKYLYHKNSQKRIYGKEIYFLTCNTHKRYPFFKNKIYCENRIEELKICKSLKKFDLYAFCLNYDHFHLLVKPDEEVSPISEIMRSLKTNYSRKINRIIYESSRKFKRQKSYHDHFIRDAWDYTNHWYYARDNYRKHWLPDDRKFHSWNNEYQELISPSPYKPTCPITSKTSSS